jgi:hypothetical protein
MRTVFTSNTSFQDAAFKAKMAGFTPVGSARNPRGAFVVFGERKDQQVQQVQQDPYGRNRSRWW